MLEQDEVEEVLDLHRRSYALLRWIDGKVRAGTLPLGALHGALDAGRAAAEWLCRNAASLPSEARPPDGTQERFGHLLASYLNTSFEVATTRRTGARSGCGCEWCSYLVAVPHLRARQPSRLDERIAAELKLDCLEALAVEAELPMFREELAALLAASADLQRPLAMGAYVRELCRRTAFRGQGRPVLALWRELAWREGRPDRRFELSATDVLRAEARVIARLRDLAR
jgi:hypothetical protein